MDSTKDGYSPSYGGNMFINSDSNLSIKIFYKWNNQLYKPSYDPCVFIFIGWF